VLLRKRREKVRRRDWEKRRGEGERG